MSRNAPSSGPWEHPTRKADAGIAIGNIAKWIIIGGTFGLMLHFIARAYEGAQACGVC